MAEFEFVFNWLLVNGDWGMDQLVNQQLVNINTKKQLTIIQWVILNNNNKLDKGVGQRSN